MNLLTPQNQHPRLGGGKRRYVNFSSISNLKTALFYSIPISLIASQTGGTTKELAAAKAIPNMNYGTMSFQSVPASQRLLPKLAPNALPNPPTGERKTGYLRQPQP